MLLTLGVALESQSCLAPFGTSWRCTLGQHCSFAPSCKDTFQFCFDQTKSINAVQHNPQPRTDSSRASLCLVIQLTQACVHRIRGCHHCDRSLLHADPFRKCIHKRDICDFLIANSLSSVVSVWTLRTDTDLASPSVWAVCVNA